MDPKSILKINMLGNCSLAYGERVIDDAGVHGSKPWTLLEYLVTFRNREIPIEELLGLLYPEGQQSSSALKTLVYRVRAMLEELGLPSSRDMILVSRGSYAWNTSVPMELDVDRFELDCQRAGAPWIPPEEKLALCLAAADLYRGDFLARSMGEPWVAPLTAYYHNMYVRLVKNTLELLAERQRWKEVEALCAQAIAIDSYQEYFYFCLTRALIRTGRPRLALEQYKRIYNIFCTELGAPPPAELTALYREINRELCKAAPCDSGDDLADISRFLFQEDRCAGAFFCELEVFREICNLEARSRIRSGQGVYLALISAAMRDGSRPPLKLLNSYMDKLGDCIQGALRRGDVVSKYSVSQYVLLLPTSSAENGALALGRIVSRFLEKYPRCPLLLQTAIRELEEQHHAPL